jgi:rhamnogalacturonan acetylesterase
MKSRKIFYAAILIPMLFSFVLFQKEKPVFYIIGDSTVKNGDGTGKGQLWGWGDFIAPYFDTTKIGVQNHAIGGRSSRTFITEGTLGQSAGKPQKRRLRDHAIRP